MADGDDSLNFFRHAVVKEEIKLEESLEHVLITTLVVFTLDGKN